MAEQFKKHLRTTDVTESMFATMRHRTVRSKGCPSNKTALAMIFKPARLRRKAGVVSTSELANLPTDFSGYSV